MQCVSVNFEFKHVIQCLVKSGRSLFMCTMATIASKRKLQTFY